MQKNTSCLAKAVTVVKSIILSKIQIRVYSFNNNYLHIIPIFLSSHYFILFIDYLLNIISFYLNIIKRF